MLRNRSATLHVPRRKSCKLRNRSRRKSRKLRILAVFLSFFFQDVKKINQMLDLFPGGSFRKRQNM